MNDFQRVMGAPNPAAKDGVHSQIRGESFHNVWGDLVQYVGGAGWYKNRFIYLFGEGLEKLKPCLDAWSFMLPENKDRIIIGRTAYGALFCLENANTPGQMKSVHVLDPLNLEYFGDANLDMQGLVNHWLPKSRAWMAEIMDTSLYDQVVKTSGQYLDLEEILSFKKAAPFGGKLEANNLQLENIVEYYNSTAPIYKDARDTSAKNKTERTAKKKGAKEKSPGK